MPMGRIEIESVNELIFMHLLTASFLSVLTGKKAALLQEVGLNVSYGHVATTAVIGRFLPDQSRLRCSQVN